MELSDDCTSEDDKTLSISNNDLNKITNDDTDYEYSGDGSTTKKSGDAETSTKIDFYDTFTI